ncbi:MAG: ABC transporter permease [Firmicutes bacterium]|nr:ABC transporter permease [Bacillota bacterium]
MGKVLAAELSKWRGTRFFWVTVAGALAAPALASLFALSYRTSPEHFLGQVLVWYTLLTGPLTVTLIGAQMVAMEYQCDTWKVLLSTPVPRSGIYLAKLLLGVAWVQGLTLLVLVAGWALSPLVAQGEPPDLKTWTAAFATAGLGLSGMLPVYHLTGLLSRSFFVPSGLGIVATFAGLMALQSRYAGLYPVSATVILTQLATGQSPPGDLLAGPGAWAAAVAMPAVLGAALSLGYLYRGEIR